MLVLAIVDCFYAPLTIVVAYLLFGETVPGTTLLKEPLTRRRVAAVCVAVAGALIVQL
ncbi:MAG: hypothetical protein HZB91_14635 [Elusimicrobia bacterium]|nr:hypothetical protein [Elusimicrobiota bacterium]